MPSWLFPSAKFFLLDSFLTFLRKLNVLAFWLQLLGNTHQNNMHVAIKVYSSYSGTLFIWSPVDQKHLAAYTNGVAMTGFFQQDND